MLEQVDLHGLHVDEALRKLESHLIALGGLNHPGGTLIQVSSWQILKEVKDSHQSFPGCPHVGLLNIASLHTNHFATLAGDHRNGAAQSRRGC